MLAYQLVEWQQPPELREVEVPEPGPGEILVKVGGAGACHSDLHVMEWPAGVLPYELPFTLGHENAGWIESIGAGVTGWEPGDAVAVYGPWGCGRCRACRATLETLCEHAGEIGAAGGGLGRDGGMAEYMLVPDPRLLVALGDLDPRDAAPLSDAALTPYHALKLALPKLTPGTCELSRRDRRAHRRPRSDARARLRRQRRHAGARRQGGRGRRVGDGDRGRRRQAAADVRHDALRREHHVPVLGKRDRARRSARARPLGTHPRARRALPARPSARRLPAHARRLAHGASRDHAERVVPPGVRRSPD